MYKTSVDFSKSESLHEVPAGFFYWKDIHLDEEYGHRGSKVSFFLDPVSQYIWTGGTRLKEGSHSILENQLIVFIYLFSKSGVETKLEAKNLLPFL